MAYASKTSVPVSRTIAVINDMITKWGATDFGYMFSEQNGAMIAFRARNRQVRFTVPLPTEKTVRERLRKKRAFIHRVPSQTTIVAEVDQETRRKWRALMLAIKARFVAVDDGVETFDSAFLAHIVDPTSNKTVEELVAPLIGRAYDTGVPLLGPVVP